MKAFFKMWLLISVILLSIASIAIGIVALTAYHPVAAFALVIVLFSALIAFALVKK